MAVPAIFRALITTFQDRASGIDLIHAATGHGLSPSLSRKRKRPKGAKNNLGVLQSYVTYDTLAGEAHFPRPMRAISKG
jgi:hypothetical protein